MSSSYKYDSYKTSSHDQLKDRDLKNRRSRSRDRSRFKGNEKRERSGSSDRLRKRSRSNDRSRKRSRSNDRSRKRSRSNNKFRRRSNDRIRERSRSNNRSRKRSQSCDSMRERSRSYDRSRNKETKHKRRSSSRDSEPREKFQRDDRRSKRPDKSPGRKPVRSSKKVIKNSHNEHKSKKEKKKGSKKRSSSSSSDSSSKSSTSSSTESEKSSSSTSSAKLMKRLHEQRVRMIEEKKKQKELMKINETPEEKRLRRLLKKESKERKRKERMGWDSDYLHYTNTDNPFGDGNLLSTFVWSKKLDKEGLSGATRDQLELRNRQKQEENKRELEKVKKRRQERELERQQREEEMALLQRTKEAAQFQEWERQEDQFHLEQARLRSRIRMQDSRAKPIDLLARYIGAEEEVDAVEMHEPYTYLNGLATKDLEDLIEDIKVYKELERGRNLDYWHDITVIVEDELHKLRKLERQAEYDTVVGRREGIHQAVAKDVATVFRGKTAAQLQQLQTQIEAKITKKTEGVDIGYWESLLSQLKAHMARARLRDRHQENLRKKLEMLKAEQGVAASTEAGASQPRPEQPVNESVPGSSTQSERAAVKQEDDDAEESASDAEESGDGSGADAAAEADAAAAAAAEAAQDGVAREMLKESFADYESGGYSPKYMTQSQLEPGTLIVSEEDDLQRLQFARAQITRGVGGRVENVITAEEQALQRQARKGMEGDEAEFSVESALDSQVYLWSDKYRPRKPRYFNRVHTGFEWNKYNQTHYDMDNPPPKIVQGYKFNIFYPDLIDKSSTPQYFLTPCPDNRDFAILRFHAGPPYEDIAFKIVNREWEYSYKRGFRCQFHNNIFQLWFHFKRYRYRR